MVGRIHQEGERRLKYLIDLELVNRKRKRGLDQGDQRRDAKSGPGEKGIKPAERLDQPRLQPDFFLRLPQRGGVRGFARVDLAARKGHLARMGAQVGGPKGQEDSESTRPVNDRQEDGSGAPWREHSKLRQPPIESVVAYAAWCGLHQIRQA
jgi:hypothetical protein